MQKQFAPPDRVGFVGLGNMGAPMAAHLVTAGFSLVVADANTVTGSPASGCLHCRIWVIPARL